MQYFKNYGTFILLNESNLEFDLKSKANSYPGVTFSILRKIYSRGLEDFDKKKGKNAEKFAMLRVMNFLSKGKSWTILDSDLADKVRKNLKKLKKKKK
jgi:hypothetical protein